MKTYELSVVTPFHNVEKDVFKAGVQSLINQTYGFENIEWIVVFHNCDKKYIDDAMPLIYGYENIRTEVINNDIHSPSSPRNHGMRLATGKYIGFLDADDSYTPWCFEEVISHMKASGAQITWFRREYEMENSNSIPISEIVLWNQTMDEIIIDKDRNWDSEKIFTGIWGLVTSRVYDRKFLLNNKIWFDEEVGFGEDYLFNFEAYGHVSRLCYLPQMIGYHYFINSGSLVQSGNKDGNALIKISYGLTRIFETGLKYGFYMDATMGGLLLCLVRFMMGAKSLTLSERNKIKELLESYLNILKPIPVSKLYSEKGVHERCQLVKDYLLNPEKWAEGSENEILLPEFDDGFAAMPSEMALIRDILDMNADCDMGRRYNFRDIFTKEGFQAMVPISNYESYSKLIALTTRIGESGIFVSTPVDSYVRFMDNDFNAKMLPVTKDHIESYMKPLMDLCENETTFLLFDGLDEKIIYNDKTMAQSIYRVAMERLFEHVKSYDRKNKYKVILPLDILPEESEDSYYRRMLYALANEELTQIIAPNTFSVIRMIDFIIRNANNLCSDIENGRVIGSIVQNGNDNTDFATQQKAFKERANKLRKVLDFPSKLKIKDIWPKLNRIIAYSAENYSYYTSFLSVFADGVNLAAIDMTAEAMMGIFDFSAADANIFELNMDSAFYEFKEYSEGKFSENIYISTEIEVGKTYRIYVTNRSGLYRYDTERIFYITDIRQGKIYYKPDVIKYDFIKLSNLDLSEEQINDVMLDTVKDTNSPVFDYVCVALENRLCIYVEAGFGYEMSEGERIAFEQALEDNLCNTSSVYKAQRENGSIKEILVRILESQTRLLFSELKAMKNHVSIGSVPPVHLIKDQADKDFFEKMCR